MSQNSGSKSNKNTEMKKIQIQAEIKKGKDHKSLPPPLLPRNIISQKGNFLLIANAKHLKGVCGILRQQSSVIFQVLMTCPKMSGMCFCLQVFSCNLNSQFFVAAHFDKLVCATPFPSYLQQPTQPINPSHCAGYQDFISCSHSQTFKLSTFAVGH